MGFPVIVPSDARPAVDVAVAPVVDAVAVLLLVPREQPRVVGSVLAPVAAVDVGRLAVAEPGEARLELLVYDPLHVLGCHSVASRNLGQQFPFLNLCKIVNQAKYIA